MSEDAALLKAFEEMCERDDVILRLSTFCCEDRGSAVSAAELPRRVTAADSLIRFQTLEADLFIDQ